MNSLDKIFDKKTVAEQQQLAALFGEVAYEQIHKISEKNGWTDSSPEKIALHALVGGIMADLGGESIVSGATGAAVNEAVQGELKKQFQNNPDMWQWASALIGATVAELTGSDAQTGASTAASGTKNNAELLGPIEAFNLFAKAFGYVIVIESGVQVIKNSAGEVIASWSSMASGWVDSAGDWIGDNVNDFILWAKKSGKEKANDVPSWAKGNSPYPGESGKDFAKRLMDEKYGEGNYDTGPGSEYNKIKKWGDRGFN